MREKIKDSKRLKRIKLTLVEVPLDLDKLESLGGPVAVVEEELLAEVDVALGKDADPVVAINEHDACVAVRVDRVIGEAYLVSLALGVHHVVVVEVEEEGALESVVDLAATVGLVLSDDLATVLGNEVVLGHLLLDEDAPAGDLAGRQQQVLPQASLDVDVDAAARWRRLLREVGRPTRLAQVRVALSHCQVTRTVLGVALRLALAPTEPVDAVLAALAELFAKITYL